MFLNAEKASNTAAMFESNGFQRSSICTTCSGSPCPDSRCAASGRARRRRQISHRTDVFWNETGPSRSFCAGVCVCVCVWARTTLHAAGPCSSVITKRTQHAANPQRVGL